MRTVALILTTIVAASAAADRDDRVLEGKAAAGAATRIVLDAGVGEVRFEVGAGDVDLEFGGRRIKTDGGYGPGESIRLTGKDGPRIRLSVDVGDIEARIGR
jgi:hypothetical protein